MAEFVTPPLVRFEIGSRVRVIPSETAPDYVGLTGVVRECVEGKNFYGGDICQHRVEIDETPENLAILAPLPFFHEDLKPWSLWLLSWELHAE